VSAFPDVEDEQVVCRIYVIADFAERKPGGTKSRACAGRGGAAKLQDV